jgi:acetyltransferase-like isoleucine patch superfamily enzyme
VVFKGKIRFDLFSFIEISNQSKLQIGDGMRLRKSRIRLKNGNLFLGVKANIKDSILVIADSNVVLGDSLNIKKSVINLMGRTDFIAGDYLLIDGSRHLQSGFYSTASTIKLGENVNVYAHVNCNKGTLKMGDHVFVNEGTQMRCTNRIEMGSHIFISYDCIIFDTNTHSLNHIHRREEMRIGFPNSTIQNEEMINQIITAPITIHNDVWIGPRAIILKGSVLGNAVIVGAASVVSGIDVPDGKKALGNPAQIR